MGFGFPPQPATQRRAGGRNVLLRTSHRFVDSLSLSRQFTLESGSRAIDACEDPAELRRIAKMLLSAWQMQSDLTRHYGAQALGLPTQL
jgi:hypothetical protein